ncbi:U2 snRNP complex subunit YSF3 TDEL_0B04900 [Torulaspora delbrueckii]|uniref:Splicing factor subunit n=1 Tax=Torulaspora delbrueckii TaxID=4950 RepID=G8ZPS5_TORDE|nr:hypothetical protein TDEL_0B04900 [Torulaspora delbrueckii]CCE90619.1 hypothetical protein TDEL_0B04900 [Torulaspora delbrueckii]
MSYRQRQQQQYLVLKQKYVGLGKENTTQEEWQTNVHRDTYNTLQGHSALLEYVTLAKGGLSKRSEKIQLIKKMAQTTTSVRSE